MKQITFITVQADNVVLWGNPAGALWNKSVLQRTESVTQGRACGPVYYEDAVPNMEFQSLENMGIFLNFHTDTGTHLYHVPAFSHLSENHVNPDLNSFSAASPVHPAFLLHSQLSPLCLPALVSVYGQCTVTSCQLVTECRPASEGLGPAYKTTHWLQGGYSQSLCERVCGVTTSLTNCTMYANTPH